MGDFDRTRMIKNINDIAKRKKIKIGDLESYAGVSAGYLSRLIKDDTKGSLSAEVLFKISEKLETSMDMLAYYDPADMTSEDKKMLCFLDKLCVNTENNKIKWKILPPILATDKTYEFTDIPALFRIVQKNYCDENDQVHYWNETEYDSRYVNDAIIGGDCFTCQVDNSTSLLLIKAENQDTLHQVKFYEMYFLTNFNRAADPILCTKLSREELSAGVDRLYLIVERARTNVVLSNHAESVIDSFLSEER